MKLPHAEDINYWRTSQSSPDKWLEKASALIEDLGGNVLTYAFGRDPSVGSTAFLFQFEIEGQAYKIVWPILPTKSGKDELAAKRQAATLMFHDIKNKCLNALIKGHQRAFFEYMMLPDGRTAEQATFQELMDGIPQLIISFGNDTKLIE